METAEKRKLLRRSAVAKKATIANSAQLANRPLTMQTVQRAMQGDATMMPGELLALQRSLGNRAVSNMLGRNAASNPASVHVQTKLMVGSSTDLFEQEADTIADQVMRQASAPSVTSEGNGAPQSTTPISESAGQAGGEVDQSMASRIQRAQGSGHSLPTSVRRTLEPALGADLGGVKVHHDQEAVQLTRELGAKAFTHKNHIFYGADQTPSDLRLTAHEAVHTLQQGAVQQGAVQQGAVQQGAVQQGNGSVQLATPSGTPSIQRDDEDDKKKVKKLNKKIGKTKFKKGLAKVGKGLLTGLDWLTTAPLRLIDQASVLDLHVKDLHKYRKTGKTRKERGEEGLNESTMKRKMGRLGLRQLLSGFNPHSGPTMLPWASVLNPFFLMTDGQKTGNDVGNRYGRKIGNLRQQKQEVRQGMNNRQQEQQVEGGQQPPMDEETLNQVIELVSDEDTNDFE